MTTGAKILRSLGGLLAGFLVAEFLTACLQYYGLEPGTALVRAIDPSYRTGETTRDLASEVYWSSQRSPYSIPNDDLSAELALQPAHSCMLFMGLTGEQALRNLYTLRYGAIGLPVPDVTNANCTQVTVGPQPDVTAVFVRWFDGPTCLFARCAIDVWLFTDGNLVLSIRTSKIGVAATRTNGYRDIVVDSYYLFTWDGKKYVPRYF